jgi:hypothetical protein
MLTPEQQEARRGKIGASFGPKLMAGDEEAIGREWMRLVEHPDYKELDLSEKWGPAFGSYIEPFCLDWHERVSGYALTDRGVWVDHPELAYVGCTLDAYRCTGGGRYPSNTCLDAKQWSRWASVESCIETYPAQLVIQQGCTRAEAAALLICHGGDEPVEYPVLWPEEYEAEVWRRLQWFWDRVETLQPPCKLPGIKQPLINAARIVDMGQSNIWAEYAAMWLENREAADLFKEATKGIKELVEPDVVKAFGHGICATRSKAGALTIKGAH